MYALYVLHYLKGFVACSYSPVLLLPGVRPDVLKVSTCKHQINCTQVVKTSNCKVLYIHLCSPIMSQSDGCGHEEVKGDVCE